MFAFALWDTRARKLILARDRMGEKPLYVAQLDDSLYFCSELKALVRAEIVPFQLDPQATHLYYHYGYVPEPQCIIQNVRKLPAAHLLTVDIDSWRIQEHCYWRMEDAPALSGNPAQCIREQLEEVSGLVTRADVPVGIALSGGLDASTVAALAKSARRDVHAFCVGYKDRPWQDERDDAAAFADYLDMPIHTIELSTADVIEQFSRVNYYRDDPMADIAGIAIAAVAQLARRESVPVLMFGHGGDELFWGYEWVRRALDSTRRRNALKSGLRGLVDYVRVLPPPLSFTHGLQWALSGAGLVSGLRQYQADRRAVPGRVVFYETEPFFRRVAGRIGHSMYSASFAEAIADPDVTRTFTAQRPESPPEVALIRLICETYLLENGIAQSDRLTMASSVESRLPLVDYRLVETVIGLHKTYPLERGASPKAWLREATSDLLPDFVLQRRKRGFSPPWREWGRALSLTFGDQLPDGYLVQTGVLRPEAATAQRRLLRSNLMGPDPLAGLSLSLENWCRHMITGSFQLGS
jgi:asparagine synthase (glutamine-hydrolysing)